MDFTQSALTLDKHREYLIGLAKEDITHVIKSVIFHIEKQNFFEEVELNIINSVVLSNEPFNNLYFKYNKEHLPLTGTLYLQTEKDLYFVTSLFYNFKMRNPMLVKTSNPRQCQIHDLFLQALLENQIKTDFLSLV